MEDIVNLYLKLKLHTLKHEFELADLRFLRRNWKNFNKTEPKPIETPLQTNATNHPEKEAAEEVKKIQELEYIIKEAELMLAKSNSLLTGKQSTEKKDLPVENKAKPIVNTFKQTVVTTAKTSIEPKPPVVRSSTSSASSISSTNQSKKHKPVYMNAPYKTDNATVPKRYNVNIGYSKPKAQQSSRSSLMSRSSSVTSIRSKLSEPDNAESKQQQPKPTSNEKDLVSTLFKLNKNIKENLVITSDEQSATVATTASKNVENKIESDNSKENREKILRSIQNATKENYETRRKLVALYKKPMSTTSRISFIEKFNRSKSYDQEKDQLVKCSDKHKLCQANILYQRLKLVALSELVNSSLKPEGELDLDHLKSIYQKLKESDSLINKQLKAPGLPIRLSASEVDCRIEYEKPFIRNNYIYDLLVEKFIESYYKKESEIREHYELKCQQLDLIYSMKLLDHITKELLEELNEKFGKYLTTTNHLKYLDEKAKLDLLDYLKTLLYFITSKRAIFVKSD